MTTFQITLHETYYNNGYFNVPIAYDEYLTDGETITLVLGEQKTIPAKLTRLTNQRVTRIFGRKALADWFQANFALNDTLDITVEAPDRLRLQPSPAQLAEPFATIFRDWDEANWALDFLREMLARLGVEGPDDERVALSLPKGNRVVMRLIFGKRTILEFEDGSIRIRLPEDDLSQPYPLKDLSEMPPDFAELFERSVQYAVANWPYRSARQAHQPKLMAALFDPELRAKVLAEGLADDTPALAEPFVSLFRDWDEANWALDFMRETLERLGVTGVDDQRVALTTPIGHPILRLNVGNWVILDFIDKGVAGLTVPENKLLDDAKRSLSEFAEKARGEKHYYHENIPNERLRNMSPELKALYERAMQNIAFRFNNWRRTPWRRSHQPELMAALFDPELRAKVLAEGVTPKDEPEDVEEAQGYFSPETVELLAALHKSPRKETYQARREDYRKFVEQPLQQLMKDVIAILPSEITEVMETEKRLFSRILKNDYGQGGAWAHYWGALYPKNSKRIEGPQLSMWVNHRWLEFGFYVGEYGVDDRRRLQANCRENYDVLVALLDEFLADTRFVAGRPDTFLFNPDGTLSDENATWRDWLADPAAFGFDLSRVFPFPEPFQFSKTELRDMVARTYRQLFPLVLLTISDDPLPAIKRYVQIDEQDTDVPLNPEYLLEDMAAETGFALDELQRWARALERKNQVVLYGPPGTGKTFIAERLARHVTSGGDGFRELVQFHPAYAYEDFMQGIRPETGADGSLSYKMKRGRFLNFCSQASERKDPCVLIIDEINRANLARVFGELMYLLEYRKNSIPLAGGGTFRIPENVRIIGTMNTADRSIALVDHALRRRFAFLYLPPNYNVLRHFHQRNGRGFPVEALITQLQKLNRQIDDRHYEVGISFFLREFLANEIADIWQMEIEPYLEEYFFDRPDTANDFRWENVRGSLNL